LFNKHGSGTVDRRPLIEIKIYTHGGKLSRTLPVKLYSSLIPGFTSHCIAMNDFSRCKLVLGMDILEIRIFHHAYKK